MCFLKRIWFDLRRRVNRKFKALERLQQQSHLSLDKIVKEVEVAILAKKSATGLTTQYTVLGGANNLGFLRHTLVSQSLPQTQKNWITKFALNKLLIRESFFLQWHQENIETKKQFAPEWLTSGQLGESNVLFIVSECLRPIKSPNFEQVAELYRACKAGGDIFQTIKTPHTLPPLEPGSRIRDVLVHLVCQFDSPDASVFLDHYIKERNILLSSFSTEMAYVQKTLKRTFLVIRENIHDCLGLVHGDFKASNMMLRDEKKLKLIDFQYWCYGVRVWDIAFFLSKQKIDFQRSVPVFIECLVLSEQEKKLLIFFYVVAVLLHPKPKQFHWQFKHQLLPALMILNSE